MERAMQWINCGIYARDGVRVGFAVRLHFGLFRCSILQFTNCTLHSELTLSQLQWWCYNISLIQSYWFWPLFWSPLTTDITTVHVIHDRQQCECVISFQPLVRLKTLT